MADNRGFDQPTGSGVGNTSTGGTGSTGYTGAGSSGSTGSSGSGAGSGTATALSQTAQDYVADKVSVVGDKLKDLQNADLGQLADNAKDYARKNPGQAILISAGVGLLLGLIVRGRR